MKNTKNTLVKVGVASYLGLVVLALAMTTTTSFAQDTVGGIVEAIKDFQGKFTDYAGKIEDAMGMSGRYGQSLQNELALTETGNQVSSDVRNKSNEALDKLLASSVLYVPSAASASLTYARLMPTSEDAAKAQAKVFNARNYLNTYVLKTTPGDTTNFINTLSNAGNPIQALPAPAYNSLADNPSASTFLSGMASFTARESVGIGALMQLINERTPLESGGKPFVMSNGQAASALSYDEAITSQRMNADWYNKFLSNKDTTPGDLQRENVLIAAESLHEQFEIRMQLEQANATLATLLLSYEEGTNKPLLLNARNEAVTTALKQ